MTNTIFHPQSCILAPKAVRQDRSHALSTIASSSAATILERTQSHRFTRMGK